MKNIFSYPIDALNTVRTNVWAVILIAAGSMLVLHGHSDVGASLTTGGFAILRSETVTTQQQGDTKKGEQTNEEVTDGKHS